VDAPYFDVRIALPYLLLTAVNLAALAAGAWKLRTGQGDLDSLAINAAWALHNLIILGAAVGAACERPQVRAAQRVPARLPAMLRFSDGTTAAAETRDLGRDGASITLRAPATLSRREQLWLSLFFFDEEQPLPAEVLESGGRSARADEELTGAAVRIVFAGPVESLEVLVNDERLALLSGDDPHPPDIPVARTLLADRNTLSLRLRDRQGRCLARPAAWAAVRSIGVVLQANPVPLPNELALLPLPFFDRGYDASATVPLVLGHPPSRDEVRLGALVASWFAVDAPIPLAFDARIGALPDSRAIVLVGGS